MTISKNDSAQEPIWQRQLMLEHRGDTISIELPPKQEFVVEFSLSKPFPWNPSQLPDLAAAAEPVSVGSDRIDWQIFNLGNTAARNVTVQLSVGGKTHATQTIRELPAISDYRLGSQVLSFSGVSHEGELTIVIDPENVIDEITERNNRASRR